MNVVSRTYRDILLGLPLVVAALLAGCKGAPAFVCEESSECNPGGTCESTGFCSFPDTACDTGRRYSSYAGDGLSDTCVSDSGGGPGVDAPPGGNPDSDPLPTADARSGGCIDVGGGSCLELPGTVTVVGEAAADWTCPKYVPGTAAGNVPYSGRLEDVDGSAAANGTVQWFEDFALTDVAAQSTANASGNYTSTLPTGTTSRLNVRVTATGKVETLHWQYGHRMNPVMPYTRDYKAYSNGTLSSIASGAGTTHTPGTEVVYGYAFDCLGGAPENVIAVLSSTSSTGARAGELPTVIPSPAYYNGRPRAERTSTDSEGNFFFFRVPALGAGEKRYMQLWGFVRSADIPRGAYGLTLISEIELPGRAGSVISVEGAHTEGPFAP